MGDPGAVEAVGGLALLVLAHLGQRALVGLGVAAARDERGHPADRERATPVAGADQKLGVGPHERRGHGHRGPVRQHELPAAVAEVLDHREQVVPAARVQARGVLVQLEEDLLHLHGRRHRLDQDGCPHGPDRQPERLLGSSEHVVPQPRLEVALRLRQVEVRPAAAAGELGGVVEHVEPEVDECADQGSPVDLQVPLVEVPAAGPGHDHGQLAVGREAVVLALGRW